MKTMKVQLLQAYRLGRENQKPGAVLELDEDEALYLIKTKAAKEYLEPKIETPKKSTPSKKGKTTASKKDEKEKDEVDENGFPKPIG